MGVWGIIKLGLITRTTNMQILIISSYISALALTLNSVFGNFVILKTAATLQNWKVLPKITCLPRQRKSIS